MHGNMLTVLGRKMSKSEGNGFTPEQLITGDHKLLEQGYSPMTVRFFMLQGHYASTLDFSNDALRAAEKGYKRLMDGMDTLQKLEPGDTSTVNVESLRKACFDAMNDDFNTPILLSKLFDGIKTINLLKSGSEKISSSDLDELKSTMTDFVFDVLGFREEEKSGNDDQITSNLIEVLIDLRKAAKLNKDFTTADQIRSELKRMGVTLNDSPEGTTFQID